MFSPGFLSSLPLFRGSARRNAGFLLAAVAALILAGCGGGSGGCGGGMSSGYQVDGIDRPGLLACGGSSAPAGMMSGGAGGPTDVANLAMVAQNLGVNTNAYLGVYYAMPANLSASVPMPAAAGPATLSLPAGPVHPAANPNDYALTASASGYYIYCEVAGSGYTFFYQAYPLYNQMTGTSAVLRINYPTFTTAGSFTINCVGINGAAATTTQASMVVTVP